MGNGTPTAYHPLPTHTTTSSTVSPAPPHFTVLRTARFTLSRVVPTRAVYRAPAAVPHSGHTAPVTACGESLARASGSSFTVSPSHLLC